MLIRREIPRLCGTLPGRQQEFDIFGSELHSFVVFEKTCTSTRSLIVNVLVVVEVAVDGF